MNQEMITTLQNYFQTQPIVRAWVFGSFARGDERTDSDVDLLVAYDDAAEVSLFTIGGIYSDLRRLLQRDVDLVEEGTLRPWAVDSINHDKRLIYERAH